MELRLGRETSRLRNDLLWRPLFIQQTESVAAERVHDRLWREGHLSVTDHLLWSSPSAGLTVAGKLPPGLSAGRGGQPGGRWVLRETGGMLLWCGKRINTRFVLRALGNRMFRSHYSLTNNSKRALGSLRSATPKQLHLPVGLKWAFSLEVVLITEKALGSMKPSPALC